MPLLALQSTAQSLSTDLAPAAVTSEYDSDEGRVILDSRGSFISDGIWHRFSAGFALEDGERHLGHLIMAGDHWLGFDATHPSETGNGFRCVGIFASDAAAKQAVEKSVAR